jgi:hypothetical protein
MPAARSSRGHAFGTRISSAPPSIRSRAASGNSRSKQIIAPTRSEPAGVSRVQTGKLSPGAQAVSGGVHGPRCTLE